MVNGFSFEDRLTERRGVLVPVIRVRILVLKRYSVRVAPAQERGLVVPSAKDYPREIRLTAR